MTDIYVLDACALIALLKDEQGADNVTEAYQKASVGEAKIIINKVNLVEVYYGFYQDRGKEYAEQILDDIKQSIVAIEDISDDVFAETGRLKATYRVSLADAFALAEASVSNGILLTADHHELDIVEQKENIKFAWIR
jgi:PIN domain nuclease of toxin-antitoxin system